MPKISIFPHAKWASQPALSCSNVMLPLPHSQSSPRVLANLLCSFVCLSSHTLKIVYSFLLNIIWATQRRYVSATAFVGVVKHSVMCPPSYSSLSFSYVLKTKSCHFYVILYSSCVHFIPFHMSVLFLKFYCLHNLTPSFQLFLPSFLVFILVRLICLPIMMAATVVFLLLPIHCATDQKTLMKTNFIRNGNKTKQNHPYWAAKNKEIELSWAASCSIA